MLSAMYFLIWTVLNAVFSAIKILNYWWEYLKTKCADYIDHADSIKVEFEYIIANIQNVDKVPKHVVLILGTETPSYTDLVNLIVWCVAAGISFISFYDHNGILKKNETELYNTLIERRKEFSENIIWGSREYVDSADSISNSVHKNGLKNVTSSKKVTVNIFSITDGRSSLVAVTKTLSKKALSGEISTSDICKDELDRQFYEQIGCLPDPELAIYCGEVCSTYGFFPWQIRLTEFEGVKSHHRLRPLTFINILHKYSKCEQRFGK